MNKISRIIVTALCCASMAFGIVCLAGCSGGSSADNNANTGNSNSSQADCYGDDLPVINNTSNSSK